MYHAYYGLVQSPFEMTPDPAFLYLGDTHREGLATLVYGVQARKGFVLLTGEIGAGKTTLLHALLAQLDRDTLSAFIFNPKLEPLDFFRVLFDEFGIEESCRTKGEYLLALNHFLIERLERNLTTLLIVDEAQTLSPEMLDFQRRVNIVVNNQRAHKRDRSVEPDLETLLEDVRTRGDRQHPFWTKVEVPTGRVRTIR